MSFIFQDFAEVSAEMSIPGDEGPAVIVFGVWGNIAGVTTSVGITADNVGDTLNNAGGWPALMTNDVVLDRIVVRQRISASAVAIEERVLNVAGTAGTAPAPPNVASLITKNTGLAGRQNRGRMYFPAPPEAQINPDGSLTAGQLSNFQTAANQLLADLGTNNVPMFILHTSPVLAPTEVTSLVVSNKVATQRRRLR